MRVSQELQGAEVYQRVLGPGHTVCGREIQGDRDHTQHGPPDPPGATFGHGWQIGAAALLQAQSLDRSLFRVGGGLASSRRETVYNRTYRCNIRITEGTVRWRDGG